MQSLPAFVITPTTRPALAHGGHGLFGSHWHPTGALGFVGAAGVIALAVWFANK